MLLADGIGEFLGSACFMTIFILWGVGWGVTQILKSAGNALNSDAAREAAKFGVRVWLSLDDDDDDEDDD